MSATDVTKLNYWCITQLISTLKTDISSDNTRVRIFFFVAQSAKFCPEFNIRLYDKNSESDYYFFPPPKSEYFFSATLGIRLLKKKKKHKPPLPPQVKWSFPKYIGQSKKKCFKFSRAAPHQQDGSDTIPPRNKS
jgi:hypothetical protein